MNQEVKYYAFDNGISTSPRPNSIEISEQEYKTILEELNNGKYITIINNKIELKTPERKEYVEDGELKFTYQELPQNAEIFIPQNYKIVDDKYIKKTKEDLEKEDLEKEKRRLEYYLESTNNEVLAKIEETLLISTTSEESEDSPFNKLLQERIKIREQLSSISNQLITLNKRKRK